MTTDPPEFTGRYGLTEAHCAELRKTLEVILADVGSWEQATWGTRPVTGATGETGETACGTAFCVAGHYAVTVRGLTPVWRADVVRLRGREVAFVSTVEDPAYASSLNPRGARTVPDVACEGFGLTSEDSWLLFGDRNSLRRIVEVAWLLTDGRVDLFAAYDDLRARDPKFAATDHRTELGYGADVTDAYRRWLALDAREGVAVPYDAWTRRL